MKANLLGTEVRNRLRAFPQLRGPEIDLSSIVWNHGGPDGRNFSIYDAEAEYGFKNYGDDHRALAKYMAKFSLAHAQGTVEKKASRLIVVVNTETWAHPDFHAADRYSITKESGHEMARQLTDWVADFCATASGEELSQLEKGLVGLFLSNPEPRTTIIVVEGDVWYDTSEPQSEPFQRSVTF